MSERSIVQLLRRRVHSKQYDVVVEFRCLSSTGHETFLSPCADDIIFMNLAASATSCASVSRCA
jgi:hypothetical protein